MTPPELSNKAPADMLREIVQDEEKELTKGLTSGQAVIAMGPINAHQGSDRDVALLSKRVERLKRETEECLARESSHTTDKDKTAKEETAKQNEVRTKSRQLAKLNELYREMMAGKL